MTAMFGLSLAVLVSLFLTVRMLDIARLLLGHALGLREALGLILSVFPNLMLPLAPTAVLAAVFLTFRALSAQNEMTAMKASGLGPAVWLGPVIAFGLAATLATLAVSVYAIPWATAVQRNAVQRMRPTAILGVLLSRGMAEPIAGLSVRGRRSPDDPSVIEHAVLVDRRTAPERTVIMARHAALTRQEGPAAWLLRLTDGSVVRTTGRAKEPDVVRFGTLDVPLSGPLGQFRPKRVEALAPVELKRIASDPRLDSRERREADLEFHRRLALPLACLVIGAVAAPLGIAANPNSRTAGAIPALLVFLFYYLLHSIGWQLSRAGLCQPFLGMALPNVAMAVLAAYVIEAVSQDRRPRVPAWLTRAPPVFARRKAGCL
jgi:lipopolysaccharide export system permease protein